jgi:hypothetical protein
MKSGSDWQDSARLAKAILHDRKLRRRWLARFLMLPLAMMAAGLWLIDGWLAESPWRFLLWWAGCAVATTVVMIFALYDALAVIREERGRNR